MTSKKITSLDGLKAIAMIFLFYWHSPLPKPSADLGARLCEILFVISGFLVAYNYIDENFPATLEQSYSYTSKKFKRIWPIHFFAFALVAVNKAITDPEVLFSKKTIVSAVVNLSLLQAWSTDFFSFNGATWFISALLFCYFSSPALLYVIRKYNSKVLLVLAILIRIVLEKASVDEISVWTFNYHVSPVIRCIEFFIGMNLVPLYKSIYGIQFPNNTIKCAVFTLSEIVSLIAYISLMFVMQEKWIRGYFVVVSCLPVLTIALNRGFLSKLLSLYPFRLFSKIQLEFFILHQSIIITLGNVLATRVSQSPYIRTIILFGLILVSSILFRVLCKKILSLRTQAC